MAGLSSCRDDYFESMGFSDEGGEVTMTVDFMPAAEAKLDSRGTVAPPGDGMSDIKDMCIVVFDTDNNFVGIKEVTDGMYHDEIKDRGDSDASNNNLAGETSTIRRTIRLKMEAGSYYIYAVANLVNVSEGESTYDYLMNTCDIAHLTRQEFRQLRRQWDPSNYRNNSEMTGYFTEGEQPGSSVKTTYEDDPTVRVQAGSNIHCWLRRLASKVTIDFDATNLDPSTTIYLKEVRVRDIAYDCPLLAPGKVDEKAAADTPGGLMSNSKSSHKLQFCEDAFYNHPSDKVFRNWPQLTAGHPNLASIVPQTDALKKLGHGNDKYSLFFYENMQGDGESKRQDAEGIVDENGNPQPDGVIDSPGSTNPDDPHYKDGMPAGTYVEVIAYYESTTEGNEGSGPIVYRFMLGSNAENNYDVERNHHYKLTLCFRGYANEYDWHVEYVNTDNPVVLIPNPYYISYCYNEKLELPIVVQGDIVDNTVTAEIIRNDWYPSVQWEDTEADTRFHFDRTKVKYPGTDLTRIKQIRSALKTKLGTKKAENYPVLSNTTEGVSLGFLSLRKPHNPTIGNSLAESATNGGLLNYLGQIWSGSYNQSDAGANNRSGRSLGERAYTIRNSVGDETTNTGENTEDKDGSYRVVVKAGKPGMPKSTTIYMPLYTRQRTVIKKTSYTGENPYITNQRRAQVHYSFKVNLNGTVIPVDTIIDIIQVSKIGNPAGIWREWNNASPFHVVLKVLENSISTNYRKIVSKGGWSAEVEIGSDWIMLNGGKRKIYGGNGSFIDFTYRPSGILSGPDQVRCGIILIKYHNYTCTHRIFVRQGYAPIKVHDNGVKWHSFNMVAKGVEAKSPIDEGSMFRFGKWDYPIDACNNVNDKSPWDIYDYNSFLNHANTDFVIANQKNADGTAVKKKWSQIGSDSWTNNGWDNYDGNKDGYITVNEKKCRLFKIEDIVRLRDNNETFYQYGVLYADGASETGNTTAEAYGFKSGDPAKAAYGMRGCFVYHSTKGRQIFLPLGTTGYGHRKTKGNALYYTTANGNYAGATKGALPETLGWANKPEVGTAVLRYACGRITHMRSDTEAPYQAHFYDLYRRFGALYWSNDKSKADPNQTTERSGLDLNYFTFDFNTIGEEMFNGSNGSDACFIRLVEE